MTADATAGDQPGSGRPSGRWSSGMSSEHLDVLVVRARLPRPESADAPFLDLASGLVQAVA